MKVDGAAQGSWGAGPVGRLHSPVTAMPPGTTGHCRSGRPAAQLHRQVWPRNVLCCRAAQAERKSVRVSAPARPRRAFLRGSGPPGTRGTGGGAGAGTFCQMVFGERTEPLFPFVNVDRDPLPCLTRRLLPAPPPSPTPAKTIFILEVTIYRAPNKIRFHVCIGEQRSRCDTISFLFPSLKTGGSVGSGRAACSLPAGTRTLSESQLWGTDSCASLAASLPVCPPAFPSIEGNNGTYLCSAEQRKKLRNRKALASTSSRVFLEPGHFIPSPGLLILWLLFFFNLITFCEV